MKLTIILKPVAVACLSLFALSTAHASNCGKGILFCDYFTATKNTDWTFYNRTGTIDKGRLWINGDYSTNSRDRDGWALTHVGDTTWTDYTYKFSYDNENIGGYPDHHMVTAYFRVAAEAGNNRKTLYRLDVWDPGDVQEGGTCLGWKNGAVGLSKVVNGVGYSLKDTCDSNTTNGTNAMAITVKGGVISVNINGKVVLKYTDPNPIAYGGVGVGQIWETNGWYDDVVVHKLSTTQCTVTNP